MIILWISILFWTTYYKQSYWLLSNYKQSNISDMSEPLNYDSAKWNSKLCVKDQKFQNIHIFIIYSYIYKKMCWITPSYFPDQ